MAALTNPAVENEVIHAEASSVWRHGDVTREVPTAHTREPGAAVGTLVWYGYISLFRKDMLNVDNASKHNDY